MNGSAALCKPSLESGSDIVEPARGNSDQGQLPWWPRTPARPTDSSTSFSLIDRAHSCFVCDDLVICSVNTKCCIVYKSVVSSSSFRGLSHTYTNFFSELDQPKVEDGTKKIIPSPGKLVYYTTHILHYPVLFSRALWTRETSSCNRRERDAIVLYAIYLMGLDLLPLLRLSRLSSP